MGFFGGGGGTTKVKNEATVSPAQEAYLGAVMPYQLENARIQTELAQRGYGALVPAVEGAGTSLPNVLQVLGPERALPGVTRDVSGQATSNLNNIDSYLKTIGNDPRMAGIVSDLSQGPQNSALSSVISALAPGGSLSGGASTAVPSIGAAPRLREQEMDPNVLLKPLQDQYREQVLPGITAEAARAGALGGGTAGDLTVRAGGRYASDAASMLAQQKASLMNAAANVLGAETGAYSAENQGRLTGAQLGLEGRKADIAAAGTAGNLSLALEELAQKGKLGAGGLIGEEAKTGLLAASQRSQIVGQLVNMGLAPAQAEAALAAAERNMAMQRAQVPLSLANVLMSASTGVPSLSLPFAPPNTSSKTTESMSAGAEAGSTMQGLMQMAMMAASIYAMSSATVKRDIKFLEPSSYLERLRRVPLAEWNYAWDPPDAPRRVGPIRELSPYQIKGPGLSMNPLGYAGMLHAGVMELDSKVGMLEKAIEGVRNDARTV